MLWPTPRKRGQLHSSLHVSRRQPKTKISSLRRIRGNRTRKRSSRLTKTKARARAGADRKLEQQAREVKIKLASYRSVRDRELERAQEKVQTNRGTWLNVRKVPMREPD